MVKDNASNLKFLLQFARMGIFLALSVLVAFPVCRAEEASKPYGLTLGLFVKHVETSDDTNEDMGLLAFSYNNYIGARFTNSYHDSCLFAGKRFDSKKLPIFGREDLFLRAHFYMGIIKGYDDIPNFEGFVPAFLPTGSLGKSFGEDHEVDLEFLYLPTPEGGVFATFLNFYTNFGMK